MTLIVDQNGFKHIYYKFITKLYLFSRFEKYYPLAVVCFGTVGNCISVLVFFGTKLRKQSSSYYLSSLAISDTLFLLTQLMPELPKIGIGLFHKHGFCQFSVYFTQVNSNTKKH